MNAYLVRAFNEYLIRNFLVYALSESEAISILHKHLMNLDEPATHFEVVKPEGLITEIE